ncbi:MAG: hypothetical protein ACRD28_02630 [Acidobacteriaceae bacterium]
MISNRNNYELYPKGLNLGAPYSPRVGVPGGGLVPALVTERLVWAAMIQCNMAG